MKRFLSLTTLSYLLVAVAFINVKESSAADQSAVLTIDFEEMNLGTNPGGFSVSKTGDGSDSIWTVEDRVTGTQKSKVLIQSSADSIRSRFPLCVYQEFSARNLDISVNFLPLTGSIDQAGGIVWRYQDENNYYVVRANALEDNVVLYKMENGIRSDLKPIGAGVSSYGEEVFVPVGQWSTLKVVVNDDRFAVSLNNDHLFDVQDETFQGIGKVGLWTKADSVTAFDNLLIRSTDSK